MAIVPTREAFERFASTSIQGPIVMVNLLRFADRAMYEAYLRATAPFLAAVGGEVIYAGLGADAIIGDSWDAVLLVRYPSREAFLAMASNPGYREVTKLRTQSLVEAALQPTTPWPIGG